jgi:hypothetical protein
MFACPTYQLHFLLLLVIQGGDGLEDAVLVKLGSDVAVM